MKIFLDTANIEEIRNLIPTHMVDGITTNPSLIAKTKRKHEDVISDICNAVGNDKPVSAEVTTNDSNEMVEQGKKLAGIASNVVIKVPLTDAGLRACAKLRESDIMINVTLCFSLGQAVLAAKAGANFISPFIGRLDDLCYDGMQLIEDIKIVYDNYEYDTEILAASVRHPHHFLEAAKIGADIVTIPPKMLESLYRNPLTDIGLEKFLADCNA